MRPSPREAGRREKEAQGGSRDPEVAGERLSRTPQVLQTPGDNSPSQSQNFDGPVKFYNLATTLRDAAGRHHYGQDNKQVLFAASDLSSAAALIPLACEMGNWRRSYVHMAIMGNAETPLDTIKIINGAAEDSCHITWHDARPDYASVSNNKRMETSVVGGLGHIGQFLEPTAIITTDLDDEDSFFARGVGKKVKQKQLTHIQVPRSEPSKLGFLSRLDAASLHMWHSASFDIMIQAPLESSGSLIRLLKSLTAADYTGFSPPRLIIDLPYKIDKATMDFLGGFNWPPFQYKTPGQNDHLVVRRRITEQRENPAEASLRFIESFYPSSPGGPHVLLLSPQVELSPAYFHYVKAHILEYKHSGHAFGTSRDLFGISLETPSSFLNGSRFLLPDLSKAVASTTTVPNPNKGPFRWQAPNANAALYFADKWIEAHSFLTKRRTASLNRKTQGYLAGQAKLVTKDSPAWADYFLEFMRNRGWSLHYPALLSDKTTNAIATVHNELFQMPEEFTEAEKAPIWEDMPASVDSVLTVRDDYLTTHNAESSPTRALNAEGVLLQSLEPLLPPPAPPRPRSAADDELDDFYTYNPTAAQPFPRLTTLALLDNIGDAIYPDELLKRAEGVRLQWRVNAGGCSSAMATQKEDEMYPLQAEDLFCFDDRRPNGAPAISHEQSSRAEIPDGEDEAAQQQPEQPPQQANQAEIPSETVHGSGGAAAVIDRVVDAPHYLETAKAGFKAKTNKLEQHPEQPPQQADQADTPSKTVHGSGGVAAAIDRVVDAPHYLETAKAGFTAKKAKLEQEAARRPAALSPPPPPRNPPAGVYAPGKLPDPANENAAKQADPNSLTFPTISVDHPALSGQDRRAADAASAADTDSAQRHEEMARDTKPVNEAEDEFLRLAAPKLRPGGRAFKPPPAGGRDGKARPEAKGEKPKAGKLGRMKVVSDENERIAVRDPL